MTPFIPIDFFFPGKFDYESLSFIYVEFCIQRKSRIYIQIGGLNLMTQTLNACNVVLLLNDNSQDAGLGLLVGLG